MDWGPSGDHGVCLLGPYPTFPARSTETRDNVQPKAEPEPYSGRGSLVRRRVLVREDHFADLQVELLGVGQVLDRRERLILTRGLVDDLAVAEHATCYRS